MKTPKITLLSLVTLACCSLGCPAPAPAPEPGPERALDSGEGADAAPKVDAIVMHTYVVPNGRAGELASVLRTALYAGKDQPPRGTVTALDDGRLVVVAPGSVHEGVVQLCEELAEGTAATPTATLAFDYWIVQAEPSVESALDLPGVLGPVAEEILADGPAKLSLFGALQLSSMSNEHARVEGDRISIEHRAALVDGQIVADLGIDLEGIKASLETRIPLTPGQFVVLGQVGYDERLLPDQAPRGRSLYYVVRAEILER